MSSEPKAIWEIEHAELETMRRQVNHIIIEQNQTREEAAFYVTCRLPLPEASPIKNDHQVRAFRLWIFKKLIKTGDVK